MTGPKNLNNNFESTFNDIYGGREVGSDGSTPSGISVIRGNTQGETHSTIQSEQKVDKKN